jgi:hypothetical protein
MTLVWKPERESLRNKREIICEVPELLMQILEHDYTRPSSRLWPEDPIEIRYHWGRHQRGEAWAHLLRKVPYINVVNDGDEETFMPVFSTEEHDKWNPYRKAHGADYWGWAVYKWELVPPKEENEEGGEDSEAGGGVEGSGGEDQQRILVFHPPSQRLASVTRRAGSIQTTDGDQQ